MSKTPSLKNYLESLRVTFDRKLDFYDYTVNLCSKTSE